MVKFLCDKTYSIVPNTRIQPFGNTEIDEKRGKRDTDGYAIASITKHGIDADRNGPIPNVPDGTIDTDGTNKQSPEAIKNQDQRSGKDQIVPDGTSPRVPLSPREAQEDQDETSYVWAQNVSQEKENGKEHNEMELLEGTTVTFKMLLDTWSAITNDNAEKLTQL